MGSGRATAATIGGASGGASGGAGAGTSGTAAALGTAAGIGIAAGGTTGATVATMAGNDRGCSHAGTAAHPASNRTSRLPQRNESPGRSCWRFTRSVPFRPCWAAQGLRSSKGRRRSPVRALRETRASWV